MSKKPTAVAKILTRALSATEAEGAQHPFDQIDLLVAQHLMEPGEKKYSDLAAAAGLKEDALRQRLLDPVRCRWISMELEKAVDTRLGMVIAAVYSAAVRTGDPQRARFLLEHFRDKKPERHLHLHANLDLSQLSNEELTAFIRDKRRTLGEVNEDTRPEQDSDRDGGGAEDRPADEGGADGGGEAPPASPRV